MVAVSLNLICANDLDTLPAKVARVARPQSRATQRQLHGPREEPSGLPLAGAEAGSDLAGGGARKSTIRRRYGTLPG